MARLAWLMVPRPLLCELMSKRLEDFFERLGPMLLHGDKEELSATYTFPLPVFVHGEIRVERTPDDLWDYLTARRKDAFAVGIRSMRAEIRFVEMMSGDRLRVKLEMVFSDQLGAELYRNSSRYLVFETPEGDVMIESVEIIKLGLPFPKRADFVPRH